MPRLASSKATGLLKSARCLLIITIVLGSRREYKQRKARLAGAASDQSVYDTDTDVTLDEPSVPVQNVHFDSVGQQ